MKAIIKSGANLTVTRIEHVPAAIVHNAGTLTVDRNHKHYTRLLDLCREYMDHDLVSDPEGTERRRIESEVSRLSDSDSVNALIEAFAVKIEREGKERAAQIAADFIPTIPDYVCDLEINDSGVFKALRDSASDTVTGLYRVFAWGYLHGAAAI